MACRVEPSCMVLLCNSRVAAGHSLRVSPVAAGLQGRVLVWRPLPAQKRSSRRMMQDPVCLVTLGQGAEVADSRASKQVMAAYQTEGHLESAALMSHRNDENDSMLKALLVVCAGPFRHQSGGLQQQLVAAWCWCFSQCLIRNAAMPTCQLLRPCTSTDLGCTWPWH